MPEKPRGMDQKHGWSYRADTRGTELCHWRAREPGHAGAVKVRGVPLVVLTVSKVAGPCAESRGYDGTPRMEMIREGGKTPWGVVG